MNKSEIKIRPASANDIDAILEIYSYYVENSIATFEEKLPDHSEILSRFKEIESKNMPYIVALENEIVVAYAYAGEYRKREGYRYTLEESIYVKHGHQGKGIGKKLLLEIVKLSKELGYKQLLGVITDANGSGEASISLHKKAGFEQVGRLKNVGYKHQKWADTVLMQISLENYDK